MNREETTIEKAYTMALELFDSVEVRYYPEDPSEEKEINLTHDQLLTVRDIAVKDGIDPPEDVTITWTSQYPFETPSGLQSGYEMINIHFSYSIKTIIFGFVHSDDDGSVTYARYDLNDFQLTRKILDVLNDTSDEVDNADVDQEIETVRKLLQSIISK